MAEAAGEASASLVLGEFLPFRLARAAQAVSNLMAATWDERFGLSVPAWRLLCVLAENGGLPREAFAAFTALTEVEVGTASALLLGRGLIARTRPATFSLTPSGQALHAELAGLALAAEAALITGLSPAEVHTLNRLLGRLHGAALRLAAPAPR
jgi:DNA-binding MarR family transcriptional regulator